MSHIPTQNDDLQRAFTDLLTSLTPAARATVTTDIRQRAAQRRRDAILAYIESPEVLERRRQMIDTTGRLNIGGKN